MDMLQVDAEGFDAHRPPPALRGSSIENLTIGGPVGPVESLAAALIEEARHHRGTCSSPT
jgi:hypothetical protein